MNSKNKVLLFQQNSKAPATLWLLIFGGWVATLCTSW